MNTNTKEINASKQIGSYDERVKKPNSYQQSSHEEKINALTHGLMALVLLVVAPVVVWSAARAGTAWKAIDVFGTTVFILCLILMFTASAVYHGLPAASRLKKVWNRLDHMAIFLAIAGTYTPIALSVIGGRTGWLIFIFEWSLVLAGILFKAFHFKKNKLTWVISILLYLLMGWAVVLCMPIFIARAQTANLWLVISGGVFYTLGIIFFAQKWRYAHVVWHGFVIAGALSHFVAIVFFLR